MKYEDKKCVICKTKDAYCIYSTPIVKVVKLPKDDFWTVTLHRHTSLPLKGEIKCIKYAVKKIFPKNVEAIGHQQEPFGHFHWRVKGNPLIRYRKKQK